MISRILNAGAVIVGDLIEGWALKQSRHELLETIGQQTERIRELEEELDRYAQELYELREDHDRLIDESGAGALRKSPESCAGVTPSTKVVDPYDVLSSPRPWCSECGKYYECCVCIPF